MNAPSAVCNMCYQSTNQVRMVRRTRIEHNNPAQCKSRSASGCARSAELSVWKLNLLAGTNESKTFICEYRCCVSFIFFPSKKIDPHCFHEILHSSTCSYLTVLPKLYSRLRKNSRNWYSFQLAQQNPFFFIFLSRFSFPRVVAFSLSRCGLW